MRAYFRLLGATALAAMVLPATATAAQKKPHPVHPWFNHGQQVVENLADAASLSHRLVGTAAGYGNLNSDETYESLVSGEFNYMTPENSGKWGPLQPDSPDSWYFDIHDEMVAYSKANGMAYKGHTLVWHSQAPAFVDDSLSADELRAMIDNHITTTVSRYRGDVYAWDVVNEAMAEDGSYRDSVLYRKLGESFIAEAFELAHRLDHKAHLYYNDYNIAAINAKSDGVYQMLKGLKEQGVPVDGIGFQMHLVASSAPGYRELVENFRRFADLGLKINVSELDVRISDLPWDKATNLAIQRQVYHRVVSACMRVRACESVTTWGISDRYSWIDYTFGADDPLIWDDSYNVKPAYYGMLDGFMGIRPERLDAMPNLIANSNFEAGFDGWTSWSATLERTRHDIGHGRSGLKVADRTDTWNGAVYDLTGVLRGAQTYDASVWVRLEGAKSDNAAFSAKLRCAGGSDQYFDMATGTARAHKWTRLRGELTTPDCDLEEAVVYVAGPAAGVDLIIDRASVRPQMLVPDDTGLGPNIVANGTFEEDASGWFGFGDAVVEASAVEVKSGLQSGYVSNRTASWQGPATSLLGAAEPGTSYDVFAYVYAEGGARVGATVKASCPDGDQYIGVGGTNADGWALISGSFAVPDCDLSDLVLYFEGPDAGADMVIDDIYVRQDLLSAIPNLLYYTSFEDGFDGWVAWGGSLSTTGEAAATGSSSLLLSGRTANWQGPVFDLLSLTPAAGSTVEVSAQGRVSGSAAEALNITLKTVCDGTASYNQLGAFSVSDSAWTALTGSITLPSDCTLTEASLYFDGPSVGVNTLIDDVIITGEQSSVSPPPPIDPNNLVLNPDFEAGLDGWISWGGALSATAADAHTGAQSAVLENRVGSWEGPVYYLPTDVTSGVTLNISAWTKLSSGSGDVTITIKTTCDDGAGAYNWGGQVAADASGWVELTGSVSMPACNLTEAAIYFGGPDQALDVYLDDVSVTIAN